MARRTARPNSRPAAGAGDRAMNQHDPVSQLERDYVAWALEQDPPHTIAQIAEHLDRNRSTIRLMRQKVEGRKYARPSARHPEVTEETVRRIVELVPRIGV